MRKTIEIKLRIRELEQEYAVCFHAPTCRQIQRCISELKWVLE